MLYSSSFIGFKLYSRYHNNGFFPILQKVLNLIVYLLEFNSLPFRIFDRKDIFFMFVCYKWSYPRFSFRTDIVLLFMRYYMYLYAYNKLEKTPPKWRQKKVICLINGQSYLVLATWQRMGLKLITFAFNTQHK